MRFSREEINHAIGWLANPTYMQEVAFGTRNLRTTDGRQIQVSATQRRFCQKHLYRAYVADGGSMSETQFNVMQNVTSESGLQHVF